MAGGFVPRMADARLPGGPDQGIFLWRVAGRIVSLAGCAGPARSGIRVAPAYTPPEARGRGYATALVADLGQHLLDRGRRWRLLLPDLAKPPPTNSTRRSTPSPSPPPPAPAYRGA